MLRSGVFNASGWLVTVILSIVSTPYFVYKMSLEGYGLFALLTGLIGYYSLLDLGLGQAVIKFVAEHSARSEERELHQAINTAIIVQLAIGLVVATFVTVFADAILGVLKIRETLYADARTGLYVCSLGFLATILSGTFGSVLMGLQRYDITGKVNMLSNSMLTLCIVGSLWLGNGVLGAIVLSVVFAVFSGITFFVIAKRLLKHWTFSTRVRSADMRRMFSFSSFMFISQISNLFSNYIVRIIISAFLGPAAVTLYVIPMKLISAVGGLLSSTFSVLFPFASALGAVNDQAKIRRGYVESSKLFASLSIPILLMTFVFAKPILSVWMGTSFSEQTWFVLRVLSLSAMFGSLTTVPNTMTMGLGHSKIVGLFSLGTLFALAVFIPLLTYSWQVDGTAIGMLLATFPGLFLILYETRHIFEMKIVVYLRESLAIHLLPLILLVAIAVLGLLPVDGISDKQNIVLCVAIGGLYVGSLVASKWLPLQHYVARVMK